MIVLILIWLIIRRDLLIDSFAMFPWQFMQQMLTSIIALFSDNLFENELLIVTTVKTFCFLLKYVINLELKTSRDYVDLNYWNRCFAIKLWWIPSVFICSVCMTLFQNTKSWHKNMSMFGFQYVSIAIFLLSICFEYGRYGYYIFHKRAKNIR